MMHTHKYIIPFLILFFFSHHTSLFGQQNYENSIDSMLSVVDSQDGEKKLSTLYLIARNKELEKGSLAHINKLEKEAKKEGNMNWLAKSYHVKQAYYLKTANNMDSSIYYLDKMRALDLKDKSLLAELESSTLVLYLIQNKYGLLLHHAQTFLNDKAYDSNYLLKIKANLFIVAVCTSTRNMDEGLAAVNDALRNLKKLNTTPYTNSFNAIQIYMMKTGLAINLDSLDLAINSCDSLKHYVNEISPIEVKSNYLVFSLLERSFRGRIYVKKGDLAHAKKYLNFDDLTSSEDATDIIKLSFTMNNAEYYYALGDWKKTLEYLEIAEEYFSNNYEIFPDLLRFKELKSKTLYKLMRYEESYDLTKKIFEMKDSVYYASVNEQIYDLQTVYKTERKNAETQLKLHQTQVIMVALFFITLLSIGLVIMIRRNNRMKEKNNHKIYEQYLIMKSYLEELKIHKETIQKLNHDETSDQEDTLATKIEQYLYRSEAFKNKDLTRNELALALGTNREYLTEAIRESSGKTFKDYLYDIRLEYAHQMLIENGEASIEEVYTESGFSSRSTFNRLFRDRYDMSPNELREVTNDAIQDL